MVPGWIGAAAVPNVKVPAAFTVTFPPTIVRLLVLTVLNCKVPLMVVVLAVAVLMSRVTVLPEATVTALQLVGTKPVFQVAAFDQFPVTMLVTVWQVLADPHTILFPRWEQML